MRPSPFSTAAFAPRGALIASAVLALALLGVSVAGLCFGTRGLYPDDPGVTPAFLGQDAITILIGLPLLFVATRLARRDALLGLVLWMAALFYFAYSYAFYVLHPRVTPLFPVYAGIVALSVYTFASLLAGPAARAAHDLPRVALPRRRTAVFLGGMAAMFIALWGAMLAARLGANQQPTTVEHIVWSLDGMFALPGMVVAAALVWTRRSWGVLFGGVMLVKATLLGFTLMTTTWLAQWWGVSPDVGQTAMFGVLGVAGLALCVSYFRAVAHSSTSGMSP